MNKTILSTDVKNVNPLLKNPVVYDGVVYPEIDRVPDKRGRMVLTTQSVKTYLNRNGFLSDEDFENPECPIQAIAFGLLKAFMSGKLSLNCTKQDNILNRTPIRVTFNHDGKMYDVPSVSTLSLINPFCLKRMQMKDLVCAHCYVPGTIRGINGVLKFVQNTYVLSALILPAEWVPVFKTGKFLESHPYIRLEALGDLQSTTQARNYIKTAAMNPDFSFALWTKNPAVLASAIDLDGKPENLSTVFSMSRVNLMDKNHDRWNMYFDHKFVVVNDDKIRDGFLSGRGFYSCKCGHRSCIECHACYDKPEDLSTAVERLRE